MKRMADITISAEEYAELKTYASIQELSYSPARWGTISRASLWLGGLHDHLDALPEEALAKEAETYVDCGTFCTGRILAGAGEETVGGAIQSPPPEGWTPERPWPYWRREWAELGPIGPASLSGKLIVELARRLNWEVGTDRIIEDRTPWTEPEEVDL